MSPTDVTDLLLRGPHAITVDLDGAWPKSNLDPGGCKHDVFLDACAKLDDGLVVHCVKCGCAIISRSTLERLRNDREEWDDQHEG